MNPRVTGGTGAKMRRSTLGLSMRPTLGPSSPLSSGIAAAAAAAAAMAARGALGRRPLHSRHAPIVASPSPPPQSLRALPGPFWHGTQPGPQRRRCAASFSTASLLRLAQGPWPVAAREPKDCHRPVLPPPSPAIPRPRAAALRVVCFSSTSRRLARPSKHEEGPQPYVPRLVPLSPRSRPLHPLLPRRPPPTLGFECKATRSQAATQSSLLLAPGQ